MNAKQVLNKIMAALKSEKEQELAYAKLADGTILESSTFDVGEKVSVISEDGEKSPAPKGEHELILKDDEGNDVRIKIQVGEEGEITERENVELPESEEKDEESEAVEAGEDKVKKLPEDMEQDEEVEPISEDMKKEEEMEKKYSELAYRIEEMEKKISKMEEVKEEEKVKEEVEKGKHKEKMEEEELPKLDGAPVDETSNKTQNIKMSKNSKVVSAQSTFLSKLYK